MDTRFDRVIDERDTLDRLLSGEPGVTVTGGGIDHGTETAELVYEFGGHRYQITIRELDES